MNQNLLIVKRVHYAHTHIYNIYTCISIYKDMLVHINKENYTTFRKIKVPIENHWHAVLNFASLIVPKLIFNSGWFHNLFNAKIDNYCSYLIFPEHVAITNKANWFLIPCAWIVPKYTKWERNWKILVSQYPKQKGLLIVLDYFERFFF